MIIKLQMSVLYFLRFSIHGPWSDTSNLKEIGVVSNLVPLVRDRDRDRDRNRHRETETDSETETEAEMHVSVLNFHERMACQENNILKKRKLKHSELSFYIACLQVSRNSKPIQKSTISNYFVYGTI